MAFVAQDTRGHYASEGVAEPFEHEASDGYDTCDWIIRQAWSDGTLAVFGESYVGYSAIATASSGHPSIRAAALRATSTDIAGDWLRHQGVASAGVRGPLGVGGLVRARQHRAGPRLVDPSPPRHRARRCA